MKRLIVLFMFVGLFAFPFSFPETVLGATANTKLNINTKVPDRVIVKLKEPAKKAGLFRYESLENQVNQNKEIVTMDVPKDKNIHTYIKELRSREDVEYAEPDYLIKKEYTPNDNYFSYQWHHKTIETDRAWDKTKGASSVVVAVIDGGVDLEQKDLVNRIVSPYDMIAKSPNTLTPDEHGTHVAGIIGASINNTIGVAGVAPYTKIMPIDVFDGDYASTSDVIDGIYYAVDHGADIINMSLGGYYSSDLFNNAVQYAYTKGVVVIAAAGNEDTDEPHYPSSYPNVISVGSTDDDDTISSFSNYGDIDITAPGRDIYSTLPRNYFGSMSGTSMASPVVAGVAALILADNPNLTNEEVAQRLYSTADDLGEAGKDEYYGNGRVNARKALGLKIAAPNVDKVYNYSTFLGGTTTEESDTVFSVSDGQKIIGTGYAYDGYYTVDIPKQSAWKKLYVTLRRNGQTSEKAVVTVLDGIAPSTPTVNEITDKLTTVTGKVEKNATVYVKISSKTYSTKYTSEGTFSVTIPLQKAGTKVEVWATDKAGNKSAVKTLKVKDKTPPKTPIVKEVSNKSTAVTGTVEAKTTVTVKIGSKTYTTKETSKGSFTVTIPVQTAGNTIYITAADAAKNVSSTVKIVVKDKIPPAAPTVNTVTTKTTQVSGKAEAGSTITIKVGSTTIGTGTTDSKGNFKVTIKAQKKGTYLTVTAKDKAGNVSKGTSVKVV
ncbi:S8 family peptidase [Fictibacillus barbaricus]|uniref:Subtilisin family serine protease n=1 Tax=Fictibacillus barbaricus TaxID=182136 RepID=A0ABU1U1I4_9BACL|nr:S8 family serine peptidase [Fictibacillus barbaricus]MDR7073308.1 subtilisin family serine protease [Fictibacillus barbaricus]